MQTINKNSLLLIGRCFNVDNEMIKVFTNEVFGNVRVIIDDEGNPWFVGKDVATALGYENTKDALAKHVYSDDKVMGSQKKLNYFIIDSLGRKQFPTFINKYGVMSLINESKLQSTQEKSIIINNFKKCGIIDDSIIIHSRKEIDFKYALTCALKPWGLKICSQFNVLNYRIDFYIKELNMAIEYDENNHKDYSYENQELRQKKIEKKLGCKFLRLSDKHNDYYNIGVVLSAIMNRMA